MNPLSEIITNEQFEQLNKIGVFSENGIRDYSIKKKYKELKPGRSVEEAIEIINAEFPYLQFETVRKIVHCKSKKR